MFFCADDDWGDIEGPASPPKQAAGSLHGAMAEKEADKQDEDKEDVTTSNLQESTRKEAEPRVPENGTSVAKEMETVSKDTTTSAGATPNSVVQPQKTDTTTVKAMSETPPSKQQTASSYSDIQETSALNKLEVKEETAVPQSGGGAADLDKEKKEQKAKEPTAPVTAATPAPSVMEPLSVDTELKTRDKGDMVVVGSEGTTPSSDSTTNKGTVNLS